MKSGNTLCILRDSAKKGPNANEHLPTRTKASVRHEGAKSAG
jgi:hypothetical protein